jgi:hypothetical protein
MKRFHTTHADPLLGFHPSLEDAPKHTPRLIGTIFLFFFLLYALTGGGHEYSPDGRFAFNMGQSLVLDPEHAYLRQEFRGLAWWGIGLPLLTQPTLILGALVDPLIPQKDTFRHEGHTYVLGDYPVLGPRETATTLNTLHIPIDELQSRELVIFSYLGTSLDIEDGVRIATISLNTVPVGRFLGEMMAGRDTAEWAYDRPDVLGKVAHSKANAVASRIGLPNSSIYVSRLQFPQVLTVKSVTIQYLAREGNLFIASLNLIDAQNGEPVLIGTRGRIWSERENSGFIRRLFALFTNAWITALSAVFLFLITRRLNYHTHVAFAVILLYGVATIAWPYATHDFAEPSVALGLLGTIYFMMRGIQDQQLGWVAFAGLIILGGISVKYVTAMNLAILAPIPALVTLQDTRRTLHTIRLAAIRSVAFLAPIGILGAAGLSMLIFVFDLRPPVLTSFADRFTAWLDLPLWIGLYGNLLSPGKSIFLYAPPLILALFGSLLFIPRHKWWALPFLGIPLLYLLVYSSKGVWYGGSSWGPRYLVPTVPLLMVMAAPILERAIFDNGVREMRAAIALGIAGIGVQVIAVANHFDWYFSLLRSQILPQVPESGAFLAGRVGQAYYAHPTHIPWDKENVLYLFAAPFSPLFAHVWMLAADFVNLFLSTRPETLLSILGRPPWVVLGVAIWPQHPEYLLGLDFWSMILWREYTNHTLLLIAVLLVILAMQGVILYCWSWICNRFELPVRLFWGGMIGLAMFFVLFDVAHFMQ